MDIKLKSNLRQGSKLLILVITIATLLTLMCYPLIKNLGDRKTDDQKNRYFASREFSYELFESLEAIYNSSFKNVPFEERTNLPTIEEVKQTSDSAEEYYGYIQHFNSEKNSYNYIIKKRISENIRYLIVDTANRKWSSNLTFDEQKIIGIEDPKSFDLFREHFINSNKFLDQMAYIEYVHISHTGDLKSIYSSTGTNFLSGRYRDFYNNNNLKPLTNLKVLYMVPNELIASDNISAGIELYTGYRYQDSILWMSIIGLLVVCIIGVLLSNRYTTAITERYNKVHLEIKLVVGIAMWFLFLVYIFLLRDTITGNLAEELMRVLINNSVLVSLLILIFNIGILSVLYFISYITGSYMRYITKVGIKVGVLKTSWTIKSIVKGIRAFWNLMIGPKTLVKPYRRIRTLIGINCIIISLISMAWFFGIGLAVVYSLILLWMSRKYLKLIIEDFNKLHKFTTEMEKGNLGIELEQDLGIFAPIGENLVKVKNGFQEAVEKEVKSERMKTELISNVSHDLKTPLTSIITYVDLLKNLELDETTRQSYIEILDSKSKRLQVLIEDLFEASKTASGNISLEMQELDIVALMNQVLGELKDKIDKSELIFKTNFPENKVLLSLDGRRTVRVIENLIGNSIKYALPHSRVFIDIIDIEESTAITIKNISAEEMDFTAEEIVERFSRGDASRHTEGSGLGLAISKNLVELQGGEFNIILDGDLFKVTIKFNK